MLAGAGSNGAHRALSTAAAEMKELQAEYDSFRESSHQIENELEAELSRMEQSTRAAEEDIRRIKEENKELKARLTRQLLACQRELAEAREEKCAAIQMVHDKEEVLEQAVENERRATAEVESLREALDDSTEMAAFAQTELEDSMASAEKKATKLYQELEKAHAELALFTPSKGRGAIGLESHNRVCGHESGGLSGGSEPEGMPTRNTPGMSSLFEAENSEHGKILISNVRESVSPLTYRRLMARADRGLDPDSRNGRVSPNHVEASYSEQKPAAGELREDPTKQLRMCATLPSTDHNLALSRKTKGCESTLTGSVSTCTCCSRQFPRNGRSRSSVDQSSIHGAPQRRRASSSSGNSVPVSTGRQCELPSARTGADSAMSWRPDDQETKSDNANDAFDIVDGDNEETMSDECDVFCGPFRSVEDTMRALSNWRPFAWCEPR